jgi:uncharacterized RDD family membrane protein YckC
MFCSRCGTSLVPGTTFCTNCGAPVGTASPVVAANAPVAAPMGGPIGAPAAAYPPGAAIAPPMGAVPMNYVPIVPYAGFWLRAVAYLLDALIVGVVTVPIIIGLAVVTGLSAAVSAMGSNGSENDPAALLATAGFVTFFCLLILILLGGLWLYYALLESSAWQGTVGKKALGLIVTDLDGRPITFARATGRFFSRLITGLVPLMIGYILAGITAKKQALHDMIAGTLVLRKN